MKQLEDFKKYQDTDREPKAERAAPRVKKIKNNPELDGFFALDEISCDTSSVVDRVWEEAGRDRTWASVGGALAILGNLPSKVQELRSRPDLIWTIRRSVVRSVDLARRSLRLIVSDSIFGSVVCGNCSGGLAVPSDNSGDVRCVGKPGVDPCGETYPMSEWITLYERSKQAS
jgi:hypothetical protein